MIVYLRKIVLLAIAVFLVSFGGGLRADTIVDTEYTTTEIIAESDGFAPGETVWFAVRQEIRENWHVFWANPGDAGIPLSLSWALPAGYVAGEVLHPAPQFIPVGPLASYAHEGASVFLVPVTVSENAEPGVVLSVVIDARWQACEEICVPESAQFEFEMPVLEKSQPLKKVIELFEVARNAIPVAYEGLATFETIDQRYALRLQNWTEPGATNFFFFPDVEGITTPAAPQQFSINGSMLVINMEPGWVDEYNKNSLSGVLTYTDSEERKVSRKVMAEVPRPFVKPQADEPIAVQPQTSGNVAFYLLLALFGGVILNVMPCVFPIIFVKAAAFMGHAQQDRKTIQRDGLLFTAGVLSTFAIMGGALLLLRAGGEQLGWGFHLQSPMVVALSAYVLFLVGLNLFGFFSLGENLAGAGDHLARQGGAAGSYFTGVLAVVVAAPCIGPLLTAPMGAALVQPPLIGMLIFLLMGLGLAAPYLLLSFIPSVGRLLPRPGPWMMVMKQAMAFPVFGAAAYFLWVFSRQTGASGLAIMLSGTIFLVLAVWLFEKSKADGGRAFAVRIMAAIAALLALIPLMRVEPVSATSSNKTAYGAIEAAPFSQSILADYRAAGTPVFIDFTADWCVTCQFNKLTVLKSPEIARVFSDTGTVMLVADWTVRDPEITSALEGYGASGVPLYVYYPSGGSAQILPPSLTRKLMTETLITQ